MKPIYWISMKLEEGWSPWRKASYQKYLWAMSQPDYSVKVTDII